MVETMAIGLHTGVHGRTRDDLGTTVSMRGELRTGTV